jgi:ATP synthase F0 subunit c
LFDEWLNQNAQQIVGSAQYLAGGIAIGLGAIGAAVGEGHNAGEAVEAMSNQPAAGDELVRTMLIGQAIAETSGIFALVIAFTVIFASPEEPGTEVMAAYLGAGLAMGMGALGAGVGSGLAGARASASIGRNPQARASVAMTMLLGQALASSPAVFALLTAVILAFCQQFHKFTGSTLEATAAALAAGLCMGAGAIGPGLGTGLAAGGACDGVGKNPSASTELTRTMLIGGAVAQSTGIYSFVIAFVLIFLV